MKWKIAKKIESSCMQEIHQHLQQDYNENDRAIVASLLDSLKPEHVMAGSEYNLLNTRYAILLLAKGDTKELARLVKCAKIDFRDVIYWATLEMSNI